MIAAEDLTQNKGPNIVIRSLIQEWVKSNDVTVWTNYSSNKMLMGTQCELIGKLNYISWLRDLFRYRNKLQQFDVVLDTSDDILQLLAYCRRSMNPPIFVLIHSNEYLEKVANLRSLTNRIRTYVRQWITLNMVDEVIVVSALVKRSLAKYYYPTSKISAINNGVSTRIFYPRFMHKEKFVLFVGNMVEHIQRKGITTLLRACNDIMRGTRDLQLVMIGKYDEKIIGMIHIMNLDSKTRLLGILSPESIAEWYNRSFVFVLPSTNDGYGLVANEAMACGMPVVISDGAGAADVVRKANAGEIFAAGNSKELGDCLQRIISEEGYRSRLGYNGFFYASNNLDWSFVAKNYLQLFQMAASRRRR